MSQITVSIYICADNGGNCPVACCASILINLLFYVKLPVVEDYFRNFFISSCFELHPCCFYMLRLHV